MNFLKRLFGMENCSRPVLELVHSLAYGSITPSGDTFCRPQTCCVSLRRDVKLGKDDHDLVEKQLSH